MHCDTYVRPFVCKGDDVHKETIEYILANGFKDENPRPHYADGTPAHTIAISNVMAYFDIEDGESPLITLRPIAWKSAIKEMLWIWQDQSNDLNLLRDKYGITWWDNWALPDRTIGACYGETVRRHNLIHGLLDDIKNNPYGRRHIASLWQEDDFKEPHALKPCAFMTMHTVRTSSKDPNKKVLDTTLVIRSSDFVTAGAINMFQYTALQAMIARHCGLEPGVFTCFMQNVHIYDRHIEAAKELAARSIIPCRPKLTINPDKTDFFSITIDDFTLEDYPIDKIKERNPQMTVFRDEIAI